MLSTSERLRADQIRNPQQWRQFVGSRWLLRVHVARRLDCAPASLIFKQAVNGPPQLVDGGMRLGLSHSGEWCLCVSSMDAAVGCDIERMRSRPRAQEIASHYFHETESMELGCSDTQSDFYRLWTIKEASCKARGRGIDGGLRLPAFTLRPILRCLLPPDDADWSFASAIAAVGGESYALAVAVADKIMPDSFPIRRYDHNSGVTRHELLSPAWQFAFAHRKLER